MRCVLCGKIYKYRVSKFHIGKHDLTAEEYEAKASALPEEVWEFYWSHPGLQEQFPDPLATTAEPGRMTFRQWARKVRKKYPVLQWSEIG